MDEARLLVPIQIRYSDCDMMGHVNNAVYLSYFEVARVHFGRRHFRDFLDWHSTGFLVARNEIDYLKPLLLNTPQPGVEIWISRVGNSSFDFSYHVVDADQGVYARGRTVAVYMLLKENRSAPLPDSFREYLFHLAQFAGA
ncbi:MAG: acyl-CoA thioesterase [Flavobacteriales bacterium]|nr:acyl-CoA thioesterase [Flavobacteriales bacterium]MCX7767987.1 acyl-CoA thioesterase [Flavobacteriales bacterium]MDW8409192.1 thioesterase family protein [Flavobacteriales bacterium]